MKVDVEMKITILDGPEEGRTFNEKSVMETNPTATDFGIVEALKIEWRYLHPSFGKVGYDI